LDIGEQNLVERFILPRFVGIRHALPTADDCAVIELPPGHVGLFTADPSPTPVVFELFEPDYYHYGWLLVTINASDVSAMGGTPHALTVSIDAPSNMTVSQFDRLLDGIADSARHHHVSVVGGNVRDREQFAVHGSMVGHCAPSEILTRHGAEIGDVILAFGDSGAFWLSVLKALAQGFKAATIDPRSRAALLAPTGKVTVGRFLAQDPDVICATDASDGLLGAAEIIATASGKTVLIEPELLRPDVWQLALAEQSGVRYPAAALAWGDWQLVAAVPGAALDRVQSFSSNQGIQCQIVGRVVSAEAGRLDFRSTGQATELSSLVSRRFSAQNETKTYRDWAAHLTSLNI